MTVDKTTLMNAYDEESKDIDVQDLMSQMLESFNQEKGYTPSVTDEVKIRKMLLARNYILKEKERMKDLKAAINLDWDERIGAKDKELESIDEFIESYLKNQNKGKKLAKFKADMKEQAIEFLKAHKLFDDYKKPAELDSTLLQNSYVTQFNAQVKAETDLRIEKELAQGKVTKKREGEIKLEVERDLAPAYYSKLPDFMEYVPERKSLSIRMAKI